MIKPEIPVFEPAPNLDIAYGELFVGLRDPEDSILLGNVARVIHNEQVVGAYPDKTFAALAIGAAIDNPVQLAKTRSREGPDLVLDVSTQDNLDTIKALKEQGIDPRKLGARALLNQTRQRHYGCMT
jgi:hypothetical protein